MKKQSPIILGIDFSDSSPIILRHALHAARACGSKVVAIHILELGERAYRKANDQGTPEFQAIVTAADERFTKIIPADAGDIDLEFIVTAGKPAEELGRLAKELDASYLIVSANDLTKKRLGSVAARCVRTVGCDVLIVRDWQGGDFGKIVVCTDFSKTSDRAVKRAALVAKSCGAELHILHVMYPPSLDEWGKAMDHAWDSNVSYEDECKAAVQAKMDDQLARNSEALEGVNFKTEILESEMPSMRITSHVVHIKADLVVMGTHGNSGFSSHFIGTNTERLIQDAPVSVFAVR